MATAPALKIRLQILCGGEIAMGPGKADLLDAIAATGSISGAARNMGMSYRRAWLLVDAMNRCWAEPVVETVAGGSQEKGARLSKFGQLLLVSYRSLRDVTEASAGTAFDQDLAGRLCKTPRQRKRKPT